MGTCKVEHASKNLQHKSDRRDKNIQTHSQINMITRKSTSLKQESFFKISVTLTTVENTYLFVGFSWRFLQL